MSNPMPPDPFDDEDVDLWALEQAERLARDSSPDDIRWERLDGPTIDQLDPRYDHEDEDDDLGWWGSLDGLTRVSFIGAALALASIVLAFLASRV
ncbi:MAG: hypothetical protein PF636_09590 [Actinomycetota bacterium]|jgi:hypothetical protein|nr:hypothetical protein [Actinomycetota bacterium]